MRSAISTCARGYHQLSSRPQVNCFLFISYCCLVFAECAESISVLWSDIIHIFHTISLHRESTWLSSFLAICYTWKVSRNIFPLRTHKFRLNNHGSESETKQSESNNKMWMTIKSFGSFKLIFYPRESRAKLRLSARSRTREANATKAPFTK